MPTGSPVPRIPIPGTLEALEVAGVRRGVAGPTAGSTAWNLDAFAGRLTEISGDRATAALALVFLLIHEAQRRREPVVWIARADSIFFPPDADRAGVDLAALPVVRTRDLRSALRAADPLLRSGAFGLVVLDLGVAAALSIPEQTRLSGLAVRHGAALVCITDKDDARPSIGSLVSLRAEARRGERQGDQYRCEARVIKDKRHGPGWKHAEVCRAPDGLC